MIEHTDAERPAEPAASTNAQRRQWVTRDDLLPGDAYIEGPYEVFTRQYHLRRGFCCNSGCRHCPYRDASDPL